MTRQKDGVNITASLNTLLEFPVLLLQGLLLQPRSADIAAAGIRVTRSTFGWNLVQDYDLMVRPPTYDRQQVHCAL